MPTVRPETIDNLERTNSVSPAEAKEIVYYIRETEKRKRYFNIDSVERDKDKNRMAGLILNMLYNVVPEELKAPVGAVKGCWDESQLRLAVLAENVKMFLA